MSERRLIARFVIERPDHFELVTRYDTEIVRDRLDKAQPQTASILRQHPAANWFERKAQDDYGVQFVGSYDTRPLVQHEHIAPGQHPLRADFNAEALETLQTPRDYPWEVVGGDTTYEIAVGPIHAGIIEPGHFHFSQAGEHMLHQEVRHFYKWRGIERMLQGKALAAARPIIERISGHSAIAYQWAWAHIGAQASGESLSEGQQAWLALLLEVERLAHHLNDLGFIPNDAGFAAALAWASALTEQTRRLLKTLTDHRFGFGAAALGKALDHNAVRAYCAQLRDELNRFADWIDGIPSLWDRLDTTGKLKRTQALQYDVVGVVARASGVALDRRSEQACYQALDFVAHTHEKGDVAARFRQRLVEAQQSVRLIEGLLPMAQPTSLAFDALQDGFYDTFVESALGELYMAVEIENGVIGRYFSRDPSFMNWQALHLMMPGNIIADFPLINKSCDLSYAGNDL